MAKAKSTINERAMLIQLTVRAWSGRKHDRTVTAEVAASKHADHDVGRYNKRLLPKQALEFMQQAATAARTEHYKRTLPWSDEGPRILSVAGFQDYQQEIIKLKNSFNRAADDFADNYPDFVEQAKNGLGDLYNEADYPDPRTIRQKFAIETSIMPLPDGNDLRVQLPDADIEQLRQDIERDVQAAIFKGQQDVYHRIHDVISHMATKLTEYDPNAPTKKEKKFFRDSLVTNVKELCELIPTLNVTGDSNIDDILKSLNEIAQNEPQALREDAVLRKDTAKDAQAILNRIKDYM